MVVFLIIKRKMWRYNVFIKHLKQLNIIFCFLMFSVFSFAQKEATILNEIVTDNAGIFSISEKENLKEKLTNYKNKTTSQIVVLTIYSLEGETIESYALKVFKKNKLGQKNVDNGILILFSKFDKKVRIEVGYGLEPIITDVLASRIIREIMIPNFKEENYYKGINEGATKIIELINDPELIEGFLNETKKSAGKISIPARIFGSFFLTPIFLLLFIFCYNKTVARKDKDKRTSISKLYKVNRTKFIVLILLALLTVGFFIYYFSIFFIVILSFSCLFLFTIPSILIINNAYERLQSLLKDLFTGKLGIFIFPFYSLLVLPIFILGLLLTFPVIFLLLVSFYQLYLGRGFDFEKEFFNVEFTPFLYLFSTCFLIFLLITISITIYIMIKKRESFVFSLFKLKIDFSKSNSIEGISLSKKSYKGAYSSNKGYYYKKRYSSNSSYNSDSSSSSSSSSSFSGGGGSSGGGGASGSW